MKNILIILGVILLNFSCQNQTNTVVNPNQVGTIEANDSKSTAARDFSNAYTSNNLLSAKSLFTEDAVFKINDAEMSFDDMAAGFTAGHNFFDNIRNDDKHIYTMHYDERNFEKLSKSTKNSDFFASEAYANLSIILS